MSLTVIQNPSDKTLYRTSVFWWGKYSGAKVADILEAEPSYILWCSENVEWLTIDPALLREAESAAEEIIPPQNTYMDQWGKQFDD